MKLKQTILVVAISTGLTGVLFPTVSNANTDISQFGKRGIYFNNKPVSSPFGFVANGTTYMPIWYVMSALNQIGVRSTWDGSTWNLILPAGFHAAKNKIYLNQGAQEIALGGTPIIHINGIVYKDPSSSAPTMYMPIWDVQQVLRWLGFQYSWNGMDWRITQTTYTAFDSNGKKLGVFADRSDAESFLSSYPGGLVKNSTGITVYTKLDLLYADYSSGGTQLGSYATLTGAKQALSSVPLGTVQQISNGKVVYIEPGYIAYDHSGKQLGIFSTEAAAQASLSKLPGGTVKDASGRIVFTQPDLMYLDYSFSGSSLGSFNTLSDAENALSTSPLGVVKQQPGGSVIYTEPGYVAYTYAGEVLGVFSNLNAAQQAVANSPVGVVKDQHGNVAYLQPGYVAFSSSWNVMGQYATLSQAITAVQNDPGATIENQDSVIVYQGGNYTNVDLRYPAPSNVTAAVIDAYLANHNSPLSGLGASFIATQNTYGVDANYLVSHAILESAWGKSQIALAKNNLFGYGAYDSNPGNDAGIFPSEDYSIRFQGWEVRNNYLDPTGQLYVTPTLTGMNVNYATDPNWASSIGSLMNQFSYYAQDSYSDYPQFTGNQTNVPAPQSTTEPTYGFNGAKGKIVNLSFYSGLPYFQTMHDGEASLYTGSLQNGSMGAQVATLQSMLNQQDQAGLATDGVFGNLTENAVKIYQQENNLPVTGVVNFQTWSSLVPAPVGEIPVSATLNTDQSKIGMAGNLVVQWYHVVGYGWVDSQYVDLTNVYRITVPDPTNPSDSTVSVYDPQNLSSPIATLHAGDEVVAATSTPSNGYLTVQLVNQANNTLFTGLIPAQNASLTLVISPNAP